MVLDSNPRSSEHESPPITTIPGLLPICHIIAWGILLINKIVFSGVSKVGTQRFGNHYYFVSWLSNEPRLGNYKWDWFNARNYCRKRCMDLVSIETREENEFLKSLMNGKNTDSLWSPFLAVWPHLAKFRQFVNILQVFGQFLKA